MQENENNIIEFPEKDVSNDQHIIQYKNYIWGECVDYKEINIFYISKLDIKGNKNVVIPNKVTLKNGKSYYSLFYYYVNIINDDNLERYEVTNQDDIKNIFLSKNGLLYVRKNYMTQNSSNKYALCKVPRKYKNTTIKLINNFYTFFCDAFDRNNNIKEIIMDPFVPDAVCNNDASAHMFLHLQNLERLILGNHIIKKIDKSWKICSQS